jgi:hypothetical protein
MVRTDTGDSQDGCSKKRNETRKKDLLPEPNRIAKSALELLKLKKAELKKKR